MEDLTLKDKLLNIRDLDVLNVLWSTDEEMTAIDIVNQRKYLTQSTVTAVLRKLLKKGIVKDVGVTHSGKVLSRTYRPTEKASEAVLESFKNYFSMIYRGVTQEQVLEAMEEVIVNETVKSSETSQ